MATFETEENMPNVVVDSKIANSQDEAEKQTDDLEKDNHLTEQSTELTPENIEQKKAPSEVTKEDSCSPHIPVTKLKEIPTLLLGVLIQISHFYSELNLSNHNIAFD